MRLVNMSLTSSSFYLLDRKSTRLNSSHSQISYAVFCLKKKKECVAQRSAVNRHRAPSFSFDSVRHDADAQCVLRTFDKSHVHLRVRVPWQFTHSHHTT